MEGVRAERNRGRWRERGRRGIEGDGGSEAKSTGGVGGAHPHPPPWFPPKPSSILNQAGPAWDPVRPGTRLLAQWLDAIGNTIGNSKICSQQS